VQAQSSAVSWQESALAGWITAAKYAMMPGKRFEDPNEYLLHDH